MQAVWVNVFELSIEFVNIYTVLAENTVDPGILVNEITRRGI